MTDEQARQWATEVWGSNLWTDLQIQRLKRFADKAIQQEREGCAQAVEDIDPIQGNYVYVQDIAAAIRARKPD